MSASLPTLFLTFAASVSEGLEMSLSGHWKTRSWKGCLRGETSGDSTSLLLRRWRWKALFPLLPPYLTLRVNSLSCFLGVC